MKFQYMAWESLVGMVKGSKVEESGQETIICVFFNFLLRLVSIPLGTN